MVSVGLILAVQIGFSVGSAAGQLALEFIGLLLFLFFCTFNILESSQPCLASCIAPAHVRGAALGVHNTLQALGFFVGGAAGGWLAKTYGAPSVFAACAAAMLLWLVVAWPMKITSRHDALAAS